MTKTAAKGAANQHGSRRSRLLTGSDALTVRQATAPVPLRQLLAGGAPAGGADVVRYPLSLRKVENLLYGTPINELGCRETQEIGRWANRVENAHLPFRRRERAMASIDSTIPARTMSEITSSRRWRANSITLRTIGGSDEASSALTSPTEGAVSL